MLLVIAEVDLLGCGGRAGRRAVRKASLAVQIFRSNSPGCRASSGGAAPVQKLASAFLYISQMSGYLEEAARDVSRAENEGDVDSQYALDGEHGEPVRVVPEKRLILLVV